MDMGCGDGITVLGVSQSPAQEVVGVDLTEAFNRLPEKAAQVLQLEKLPEKLHFVRVEEHKPLPFKSGHFDAIYSWSVFEHVQNVPQTLGEIHRVLRKEGVFFLQIEPLYHSPYGSHLRRLINEPWAHLLMDEASYIGRARAAKDNVREEEKDILYQQNVFEAVREYLISEFRKLNRITVDQLLFWVEQAGFHIVEQRTGQIAEYKIPEVLLRQYSEYDLRTNEIQIVLKK
jgi:ubiquinone/menaquinone biosynthesis C-methylase UbiE